MRSRGWLAGVAALLAAVALLNLNACSSTDEVVPADTSSVVSSPAARTSSASSVSPASPAVSVSPGPSAPCRDTGFDCDLQARLARAAAYLESRPGTAGVVVHDLRTGAEWHNDHAEDPTWTASTIKLAMVVDLFTRARSGEIALTDEDRSLIHAMLHDSDDDAADTLWYRYAGSDHMSYNDNFSRYGMISLEPQPGFTDYYPYWGFQKCTPEDLDGLMTHVLTKLPADERSYILREMRSVGSAQRWGVWGAGPAARPGNKNGWSEEQDGWVMNSVGFVGERERYTLTVMNSLRGEGGYADGRTTVTHVAELIFGGYFG